MHEMGIAMEIVEIAIASIPQDMKNVKVEKVNLKVGKLTAIVPESLRFCFDIVSKDTPLCDATLHIEEIPLVIRCSDCQDEWSIDEPIFTCRACYGGSVNIVSGRELDIHSIEIVDEE
ncbi:MAG: hydrogenase maturation nickel metallochaperone HypA [Desulfobacterales bacterium]|nr:MAG: hydrogenase maturation nickel metallochaperone HypA [Desulfobacterales bacterium]